MTILHEQTQELLSSSAVLAETVQPRDLPMTTLLPGAVAVPFENYISDGAPSHDVTPQTIMLLKRELESGGVDCTLTFCRAALDIRRGEWDDYAADGLPLGNYRRGQRFALFTLNDVGEPRNHAIQMLTTRPDSIYYGRTIEVHELYHARFFRNIESKRTDDKPQLKPSPQIMADAKQLADRLCDFQRTMTSDQLAAWQQLVSERRAAQDVRAALLCSREKSADYAAISRQNLAIRATNERILRHLLLEPKGCLGNLALKLPAQ